MLDETWMLGQEQFTDTIESGGTEHTLIKTHHNRVDRITELIDLGKVIEPLADLCRQG